MQEHTAATLMLYTSHVQYCALYICTWPNEHYPAVWNDLKEELGMMTAVVTFLKT